MTLDHMNEMVCIGIQSIKMSMLCEWRFWWVGHLGMEIMMIMFVVNLFVVNMFCDVLSADELQKEREAYDKVKQDYDSTIAELAEM